MTQEDMTIRIVASIYTYSGSNHTSTNSEISLSIPIPDAPLEDADHDAIVNVFRSQFPQMMREFLDQMYVDNADDNELIPEGDA